MILGNASIVQKRKLVNDIITRPDNGTLAINVQSPNLSEWREKFLEIRKDRGLVTKPPGLAARMWCWCVWGGKELEDALKRNEVRKVRDGSEPGEYYQWKEFAEVERAGHRGGMSTTGTRKLEIKQYSEINTQLAKYDWNPDLTQAEVKTWDTKAEDPKTVPEKVLQNLDRCKRHATRRSETLK